MPSTSKSKSLPKAGRARLHWRLKVTSGSVVPPNSLGLEAGAGIAYFVRLTELWDVKGYFYPHFDSL